MFKDVWSCSVSGTHQWTKGNDLQDTLEGEESCEHDVEILQHCFIEDWSSMELEHRDRWSYMIRFPK